MAIALTKLFDSNVQGRPVGGDMAIAVYACDVTGNYPAASAGDAVDFSADFLEVFNVTIGQFGARPGGGAWPVDLLPGAYDVSTPNTGVFRFFVTGAAGGNALDELGAGAYPFEFRFTITVVGRPATDAA